MAQALKPIFSRQTGAFEYRSSDVNQVFATQYLDQIDWFQQAFGVYGWLRYTNTTKFLLNQISGAPYMWQASNSCSMTPTKTLSIGQQEVQGKATEIYEQLCVRDAVYASIFGHLLEYEGDSITLTPEMQAVLDAMTNEILSNAAQGARLQLTIGGLTDFSALTKPASTPQDIWDAILATYNSTTGWLGLAAAAALSGYAWLDLTGLIAAADFNANGDYTPNPLDLYDSIKGNARPELKNIIAAGGINGHMPIYIVDPTMYAAIAKKADELAASPLANMPRISIREVSVEGSMVPRRYYVIDGTVVVVPVADIQAWDAHAGFKTSACYITTTGNIQLGAAWNELPMTMGENIAITAAMNTDPASTDYGKMFWRGFSVMAAAFADRNLVVGTVEQF